MGLVSAAAYLVGPLAVGFKGTTGAGLLVVMATEVATFEAASTLLCPLPAVPDVGPPVSAAFELFASAVLVGPVPLSSKS